jgi:hypothetical protein
MKVARMAELRHNCVRHEFSEGGNVIYLLCKNGFDWNVWYAISASTDESALETEAQRRNVEDYESMRREWEDGGKTGPFPLPLDDPRRNGYLKFFVRPVPEWPEVEEA